MLRHIALDEANIDTITDFTSGVDKIGLSSIVFTGLGSVGATIGLGEYLLYGSGTRALSYHADGVGGADAVQFATLGATTHPTLAIDFMVAA